MQACRQANYLRQKRALRNQAGRLYLVSPCNVINPYKAIVTILYTSNTFDTSSRFVAFCKVIDHARCRLFAH